MILFPPGMLASLAMMLTMAVGSASILGVAVIAPDAAPDIGVRATDVGIFSGLVYFVAMFSGSFSPTLVARYGPVRTLQATAVLAFLGLLCIMLGTPLSAVLCAILLGLAYGPINPANATVMMAVTTPQNRSYLFSIKQSGVTFGGAYAALLLPPVVVALSWRASLGAVMLMAVASVLILQTMHAKYDRNTIPSGGWSVASVFRPVAAVMRVSLLRGFSAVGFIYAGVQVCVGSYFVVYLVEQGFGLVPAGACFLFVNIGGIVGRLAWGIVADHWLSPKMTLTLIGIVSGLSIIGMFFVTVDWHVLPLYGFAFVLGASTHSWNGVYLSEVATSAPKGGESEWTGGVQFIFYGGVAVMPPLFGALIWATGGFGASLAAIAALVIFASLYLQRLYRMTPA